MNKSILIIVSLIILGVVGYFYMSADKNDAKMNAAPSVSPSSDISTTPSASAAMQDGKPEGGEARMNESPKSVKVFTVEGNNFKYMPMQMAVKKGDLVRIVFKNTGGFHDFVIDEFNVKTKQFKEGNEESIEFIADKAGSFEYYCSVGKHRAMGMKGTLIVAE